LGSRVLPEPRHWSPAAQRESQKEPLDDHGDAALIRRVGKRAGVQQMAMAKKKMLGRKEKTKSSRWTPEKSTHNCFLLLKLSRSSSCSALWCFFGV